MQEELEQMVRWMNGTLTKSLTKAVTHVVTTTALTQKSIEAHNAGMTVMIEDWIRQVFTDNMKEPVAASDPRYVKYVCPIFYKVRVCMSQITQVKKNILRTGIEKNGKFNSIVLAQTS